MRENEKRFGHVEGRARETVAVYPSTAIAIPGCVPAGHVGGDGGRARPKVVPSAYAALLATVRDRPARRCDVPS